MSDSSCGRTEIHATGSRPCSHEKQPSKLKHSQRNQQACPPLHPPSSTPHPSHLAEHVAGRQGHVLEGRRVPGRQNQAPVVWVGLDLVDQLRKLQGQQGRAGQEEATSAGHGTQRHATSARQTNRARHGQEQQQRAPYHNSQCRAVEEQKGKTAPLRSAHSPTPPPPSAHLVHPLASVVCVHVCVLCPKVAPLEAVHGAQVHLLPAGAGDAAGRQVEQVGSVSTMAAGHAAGAARRSWLSAPDAQGLTARQHHHRRLFPPPPPPRPAHPPTHLWGRPMESRYARLPLPSQMWMPLS